MGMGAMTCAMLGLPLTAVLLTAIIMGPAGLDTMPLVIVAVVASYVGRAHFSPRPRLRPDATSTAPLSASAERAAAQTA